MSTINSDLLDPFVGFTFNGIHSSNYNIVRTNNNSRFEENLSPQSRDIVTEVSGMDGQLYWGTVYTKREFNVSFAFMELSEEKLALMKAAWDDRQIHDLIFDEQSDRIWSAKMTGSA
jgi:phage-related protein